MSEYQYYEFQTVDDRLDEREMHALRAYSSRARITPTSFINEYHFGDFKGNPDAWMERYFDGFLYLANWGTHEVQLAVPASLLPAETAKRYCSSQVASSREKSGRLIVTFRSEDESGGEWEGGEGQLSALLQVRHELAQGDLRSLYLGWLLGVQAGELKETQTEPPVPPNLDALSGPQENLANFLRLDPNLLAVAARNSLRTKVDDASNEERSSWIVSLPAREKDEILIQLMQGEAARIGMELQSRFRRQRDTGQSIVEVKPRTVAELLSAAKAYGEARDREARKKAALAKARREQEAAAARERHLDSLKGSSDRLWATVDTLVATRLPKSYDQVVLHLLDLRDLAEREGQQADFKKRLSELCKQNAAKKSLINRLAKGGL